MNHRVEYNLKGTPATQSSCAVAIVRVRIYIYVNVMLVVVLNDNLFFNPLIFLPETFAVGTNKTIDSKCMNDGLKSLVCDEDDDDAQEISNFTRAYRIVKCARRSAHQSYRATIHTSLYIQI